jgi:hypothetical protein
MTDNSTTASTIPDTGTVGPGVFTWKTSTPVVTWGSSVCMLCAQHFDYIKQDRMPVPKVCKRCDP